MNTKRIRIQRLHEHARLPIRASQGAAGYDLTAVAVEQINNHTWAYDTGLAIEIPDGYEGQLRARSSIFKTGCFLANGVGTLDSDYRGPVKLIFVGPTQPYQVGERVAQLVVAKVETCNFQVVDSLEESARGNGGFGSTGNGALGYGKL